MSALTGLLAKLALGFALAGLAVGFLGVAGVASANRHANEQNSRALCLQAQRVYDGQIVYTKFLARRFHATAAQTAQGLDALRHELGKRPSC